MKCCCDRFLRVCQFCDRRPLSPLELLAARTDVSPDWLRDYLCREIAARRPS
jgi:hypothetical protein